MPAKSLFDLTGRTAIVTGSTRGIGRAIAEQLAAAGAAVTISGRKAEPCAEVAAAINSAGGRAIGVPCHIGDRAQLQTLVAETRAQLGPVDILVCNAASNPYYGPITGISDDAFDRIMHNNVRSSLQLAAMVLPEMAERGGGSMIIIGSVAGLRGSPNIGTYGISKAADFQLARNLAQEWGQRNVRVNCIAPGLVKTDFAKALWDNPDIQAETVRTTALKRIGEPDDIAGAAVFLASDAARYVTGAVLVVDGGLTTTGVM
jgi:NAD(P)-dependent dehydrogenase (short-subunit alcohol dehydrogenase family)